MFNHDSNPERLLDEIISSVETGHFDEGRFLDVLRQASLVNLWFFLRVVAAHSGPFELLNRDLHRDMCEFAQTTHADGSRSAAFLGRSHFKSTIFTEGDCAWTLLRDPDESCGIFSCTDGRSIEFLHTIQRIFDGNELFKILFPAFVPEKNAKRWNDREAVLPNRSRYQTASSVGAYGAGCNTAGIHCNRIYIDDPVGLQQLNANQQSSAEMYKIANWLRSSLKSLIKNRKSTIMYTGTRYAIDDAHAFIFDSVKERYGYWDEIDPNTYKTPSDAEWRVYYRMTRENGRIIFPEAFTEEMLETLRKDDPWTYWTQYQNHPQQAGLSELNNYTIGECELLFERGEFFIKVYENGPDGVGSSTLIPLSSCFTIQGADPAGTEKYISAKTSRTAQGVDAQDAKGRHFLISLHVDFVSASTLFDWFFSDAKRFHNYMSGTFLEAQGAFKILGPLLKEEEQRRTRAAFSKNDKPVFLALHSVTKTGEKDAVIRNTLQPLLERNLLYVEKNVKAKVLDELNVFPQSNRKDILDMWCLLINHSYRPRDEKELEAQEEEKDAWNQRIVNYAGY
jgi:hypothetical protein